MFAHSLSLSDGAGGKWHGYRITAVGRLAGGYGHELIYRSDSQIMAASFPVTGGMFMAGKPRVRIADAGIGDVGLWSLAPDGNASHFDAVRIRAVKAGA